MGDDMDHLINSDLKPSEVSNHGWIYCVDEDIYLANNTDNDPDLSGKWMMFFKKGEEMDSKWKQACELYRQGKLPGIRSMKVSTCMHDPVRTSDTTNGVICFYCGPADDETRLKTYGRNLLEKISYNSKFLRYKSDKQTRQGTRATGQKVNSMYSIQVSDVNASCSGGSRYSGSTSQGNNWRTERNNWRSDHGSANTNWRSGHRSEETNWRSGHRSEETNSWRSGHRSEEANNWRSGQRDPEGTN